MVAYLKPDFGREIALEWLDRRSSFRGSGEPQCLRQLGRRMVDLDPFCPPPHVEWADVDDNNLKMTAEDKW